MTRIIRVVEVGPRDGLQNETKVIAINDKVDLINQLSDAGLQSIEVGSFVSADWVPQMSDTKEVLAKINRKKNVNYSALVPNLHGLEDALAAKVNSIAIFTSGSETFCQKNINCTIDESFVRFKPVVKSSLEHNIAVRGYISCVLGCPYEGVVNLDKIVDIADRLIDLGCYEISLGDTIGVGTVNQVQLLIDKLGRKLPLNKIAVHFHDTFGQALVNVYAAINMGISVVDSAIAGLGGCPYALGASGNLATEDLLYMLNGLNIRTNIDINKIISIGHHIANKLNINPRSKVSLAKWKSSYECSN